MANDQEIKVKIGADTSGLNSGISSAQASLSRFAKVGAAGAATAIAGLATAMVAATKASLANVDVLTKQARSLGLTTDAFQKMSLVAGEAGVSAGALTGMLGIMQRNIAELEQGTQKQVEAFGALGLSLSDLQGLNPDEQFARIADSLDKIGDPAKKTALAMEAFGRAGRDAINMLGDYRSKIADAALFQERFGIAVRQVDSETIERSNDAVARLGMVMEGVGNRLAATFAPAIESTANALVRWAGNVMGIRVELEQFFGTLEQARASLGEDAFNKLLGNPSAIRDHALSLGDIVVEMESLATVAATAIPQLRIFADELSDLGEDAGADAMQALANATDDARAAFAAGQITASQFHETMRDIIGRAQVIVAEFSNINGADFSVAAKNISGLADRLANAARMAALARANIEAAFFAQSPGGQAMSKYGGRGTTSDTPVSSLFLPDASVPSGKPKSAPSELGFDHVGSGTGKGGTGGAVKDAFAERLEALKEGLMTEAETVAQWHEESNATLTEALEKGAVTEQEYRDMRERLEQEHQDRLKGIRQIGNESAVGMALGVGQDILSAIGETNNKALRIAKAFGAAQALISAYQGAAEALKLPFPKNLVAAGAVLAKGISFVNAIKSVNSSGGGGAAGGGASGAAGGGSQGPGQTIGIRYDGPDFARPPIDALVTGINDFLRRGGRLDGVQMI